ncbi:MAG: RluA family pseudouridine synthase [Acidobacteriota bacterium]
MQEWTVEPTDEGMRLDQWLAGRTDAGSRSRASQWLSRGKVYVNGKPVEPAARADRVIAGQRISVWMDRPGSSKSADRSAVGARHLLTVVHQDDAIVVVDKPAGLLVEPLPGREGEESTLVDLLADHFRHERRARSHVVHRIDRDTSGLVLFARSTAARDTLKDQFERRTPVRVYHAVVLGQPVPTDGTWRDTLAWDASSLRQRQAHGRDARGKDAEARYRVVEQFAEAALIEVTLVTGKRNQIRVQAAMRGHPLLGERLYRFGAPPEPDTLPRIDRQALHAWTLGFIHPTTARRVTYTSPLPKDLDTLLVALRKRR